MKHRSAPIAIGGIAAAIVLGASAGGFVALQQLVSGLPPELPASLFIVWHIAPDVRSILPQILSRAKLSSALAFTTVRRSMITSALRHRSC